MQTQALMFFLQSSNLMWIVYGVGVVSFAVGAWRWVVKPVHKFIHKISDVADMIPTVQEIIKEHRPNGGTSMRDAIDRIESSIQVINQRLKGYASSDGLAHFECNAEGQVTWVNRVFCEVTGLTETEAVGNGWVLSIDEGERDSVQMEWKNAVKDSRDFFMKYTCRRRNGQLVCIENHATTLRTAAGKMVGYVGTLRPLDCDDNSAAN